MALLQDKTVVITGAASGIGAATAHLMAEEGARLLLADISPSGEDVALALRTGGHQAWFLPTDISQEDQVRALLKEAERRFPRLDCAVNSAGVAGSPSSLDELRLEDWQQLMETNLRGTWLCMKHEIRAMREHGGAIVNVSSGAGLVATPGMGAYCASKHALLGLSKTAAAECLKDGIRVNAVLPGSTRTPMLEQAMATTPGMEELIRASLPGGRFGEPKEIAEAITWLCSDRSTFVNGHSLIVDGGQLSR